MNSFCLYNTPFIKIQHSLEPKKRSILPYYLYNSRLLLGFILTSSSKWYMHDSKRFMSTKPFHVFKSSLPDKRLNFLPIFKHVNITSIFSSLFFNPILTRKKKKKTLRKQNKNNIKMKIYNIK